MVQVNVDPEELRKFAKRLRAQGDVITTSLSQMNSELSNLGETWRDQLYRTFQSEFNNAEQNLKRFAESAESYASYLERKALKADEYLQTALRGTQSATATVAAGASASYNMGETRADRARKLVTRYKGDNIHYAQDLDGVSTDWARKDPTHFADCSSFVSAVLPETFHNSPTTKQMIKHIGKSNLRKDNPLPGDVIMWEGHVGIVTDAKPGYIQYANMSKGQDSAILQSVEPDRGHGLSDWLNEDHISKRTGKKYRFGDGAFLGFWTPP